MTVRRVMEGQVAKVISPIRAVINLGVEHGVGPGDIYLVLGPPENVVDPLTGQVLGPLRAPRGRATVIEASPRYSIVQSTDTVQRSVIRRWPFPGSPEEQWTETVPVEFDGIRVGDTVKRIHRARRV